MARPRRSANTSAPTNLPVTGTVTSGLIDALNAGASGRLMQAAAYGFT